MKPYYLILGIFFSVISTLISQSTFDINPMCDSCKSQFTFNFESSSFIKNNEYSNDFTNGSTGLGFILQPQLIYFFTENTKASAGIHLLKYDGLTNFTQMIPLFSIQHKILPELDIILGHINGTLHHQIEEPLYRFDHYYQNNIEYGVQLLLNTNYIKSDLWLNWEKFIHKNDPFQESFVFGTHNKIALYRTKSVQISLPIQMLFYHKGGEIDRSPEPILTLFNGSIGPSFVFKIDESKTWKFEPLLMRYHGLSVPDHGPNAQIFKEGTGIYLKLKFSQKNFRGMLAYWKATDFIAPKGEYLFLSISEAIPSYFESNRELITLKTHFIKHITKSIKLEFHINGYYDLINQNLDYSTGLFFIIKEPFLLSK